MNCVSILSVILESVAVIKYSFYGHVLLKNCMLRKIYVASSTFINIVVACFVIFLSLFLLISFIYPGNLVCVPFVKFYIVINDFNVF
jgi:hypothetical protein